MKSENHERARTLLTTGHVEGISSAERQWLETHLAVCPECSDEAAALNATLRSLRAVSISARPDAVRKARLAVHHRAEELRVKRERSAPMWIAVAVSTMWAILTTPYIWSAFAWMGRWLRLSNVVWETGFLMWWFLPATFLSAIAAWHHLSKRKADASWATETN